MQADTQQKRQFWNYLSQNQKDLIKEGRYLMYEVIKDHAYQFQDYSFLVFPFAKAYEGFLKQLFKDVGFISHLDYISDHYRLGKMLSPNLVSKLGNRSLYLKIQQYASKDLADRIWEGWKLGRNQIFHYFSHNTRAITFAYAEVIIEELFKVMEDAYVKLQSMHICQKLESYTSMV